jgi:hypothetical protein
MDMDKNSARESTVFDDVERLRTDYLRELTALSKMLIALSSGALTLLLSPSGIALSIRAGNRVTVIVWILLSGAAVFGFIQVFSFSSRFKSRADYLWACHMVDTLVALQASDEHLSKFLAKSDKHNHGHQRKFIVCVLFILAQGLFLLAAFGLLAYPIYRMLSGVTR